LHGAGSLAAYHGAEHISIGTTRRSPREKEHERCGSHLVGPLLATTGDRQRDRLARPANMRSAARAAATSEPSQLDRDLLVEQRHPEHPPPSAREARHELRTGLRPSSRRRSSFEVAEAALRRCLELEEQGGDAHP